MVKSSSCLSQPWPSYWPPPNKMAGRMQGSAHLVERPCVRRTNVAVTLVAPRIEGSARSLDRLVNQPHGSLPLPPQERALRLRRTPLVPGGSDPTGSWAGIRGARTGNVNRETRSRLGRHMYASARFLALKCGALVSPFTGSREGSREIVGRAYARLRGVRPRSEGVEHRLEQHTEVLAECVARLRV